MGNKEKLEFDIQCPHCGQHVLFGQSGSGGTTTCPACSKPFTVPVLVPDHDSAWGCLFVLGIIVAVAGFGSGSTPWGWVGIGCIFIVVIFNRRKALFALISAIVILGLMFVLGWVLGK